MRNIVLLVVTTCFCCLLALDLPDAIPRCRRSDPNLNECLKNAYDVSLPLLDKGLSEIKYNPINPVIIDQLSIGEGTGAVHVVQHYKNIEYHNWHLTKADDAEGTITDDGFKIVFNLHADGVYMYAHYDLNGYIMILPIVGEGENFIKMTKCKVRFTITGETYEKDGVKYAEVKTFTVKLIPELIEFDFQNLFNGDPILGPEMNHVLNENWKDLFDDVGHGYEAALSEAFKRIMNQIIKQVPYHSLFPL